MARKKYDYVIIGGGICGLILAKALDRCSKTVALVEAQAQMGGALAHRNSPFGNLPAIQKNFACNDSLKSNVYRFSSAFLPNAKSPSITTPPLKTFDSGKFKDFVGFGKRAPNFVDVFNEYAATERLQFDQDPTTWVQSLMEGLQHTDLFPLSSLTDVHQEGDRVSSLTINDTKVLEAENFLLTLPLREILALKNQNVLTKANYQKAAKTTYWSCLLLEMLHQNNDAPAEEAYVLMGSTDNSIPCYGSFHSYSTNSDTDAPQETYLISQWASFIEGDLTQDIESSGTLIREMKRQVKRAFGENSQSIRFEKFSLFPFSHGKTELKLESFLQKGTNNLYILPRELDIENNLLGRIHSAIQLLDELEIPLVPEHETPYTPEPSPTL